MCLSLRTLAVSVPSLSLCHLLFPSLSLPVLLSWALSLHFNPCCLSDFLSLFTFSVSGFLSLSTTSLCRFFSLILRLSLPLHLFCVSRLGYGVSAGGGLRVGTDRFQAPSLCTLSPEVVLGWEGSPHLGRGPSVAHGAHTLPSHMGNLLCCSCWQHPGPREPVCVCGHTCTCVCVCVCARVRAHVCMWAHDGGRPWTILG